MFWKVKAAGEILMTSSNECQLVFKNIVSTVCSIQLMCKKDPFFMPQFNSQPRLLSFFLFQLLVCLIVESVIMETIERN